LEKTIKAQWGGPNPRGNTLPVLTRKKKKGAKGGSSEWGNEIGLGDYLFKYPKKCLTRSPTRKSRRGVGRIKKEKPARFASLEQRTIDGGGMQYEFRGKEAGKTLLGTYRGGTEQQWNWIGAYNSRRGGRA